MILERKFLLASLLLASSCGSVDPDQRSASLILLPDASEVNYEVGEGAEKLSYQIPVGFPAGDVIRNVAESLAGQGWSPLAENWYNDGQTSSYTRGWLIYVGGSESGGKETQIYQWWAQWTNEAGEVLDYSLHYLFPVGAEPELETLLVQATRLSSALARDLTLRVEPPKTLPAEAPINTAPATDNDPEGKAFFAQ